MTRAEWLEMVADMTARWPNQSDQVTEDWVTVWFRDVEQIPTNDAWTGYRLCISQSPHWMPNGGEIAEACRKIQGDVEPNNDRAWGLVLRECRRTGRYGTPNFAREGDVYVDSQLAKGIVKRYGWSYICTRDESEIPFLRRDTRDMATEYAERRRITSAIGTDNRLQIEGGKED